MNFKNPTMSFNPNAPQNLDDQIKSFWEEKQLRKYQGRQYKSKGLPAMRLVVRKNTLYSCGDLAVRPIEACWVENDELFAYATGLLFGASVPGVEIDSEEMVEKCDYLSQHYCDVGEMLYYSHSRNHPFCDVGVNSQWLAEIGILEVHPKHKGKGIGVNRPLKKCSSNAPGSWISKKRIAQTGLRSDWSGHFGLFAGRFARSGRTYPMVHA
jgi:hypothetical protein